MTEFSDLALRYRAATHDLNQDRMALLLSRETHPFELAADGAGSTTVAEKPVFVVPTHEANGIKVKGIRYTPRAAVTASDSDYATLTIAWRDGLGGGSTTVGTLLTKVTGGTGNMTAFVPYGFTLQADANLTVPAGGVLTFTQAKAGGSGVQLPVANVEIDYDRV